MLNSTVQCSLSMCSPVGCHMLIDSVWQFFKKDSLIEILHNSLTVKTELTKTELVNKIFLQNPINK